MSINYGALKMKQRQGERDANQLQVIKQAVERLPIGDFEGLDIQKLQPHPHDFRLRVGGIRMLFTSEPRRQFIFQAGLRGDVYKWTTCLGQGAG